MRRGAGVMGVVAVSVGSAIGGPGEPVGPGAERPGAAKNVVFILADGMGVSMAASAEVLSFDAEGELAMASMPVTGLVRTTPLGEVVTDSAASATAYATGCKTANGSVGMLPDGTVPSGIVALAEARGMATGLVTTVDLTDASPAAFAAAVPSRRLQADIYQQMITSGVDVLVGGLPTAEQQLASAAGVDPAEGPLLAAALAERAGVRVFRDAASFFSGLSAAPGPALFAPPIRDAAAYDGFGPPLAETVAAVLPRLAEDPDGFFLFVECEETDSGGHANDTPRVVAGVREADAALKVALAFAATHPGTLVVLTADHDTGAFSVGGGQFAAQAGPGSEARPIESGWFSTRHTAQWVPIFASGPGSAGFTGVHDNTRVFTLITAALGLRPTE